MNKNFVIALIGAPASGKGYIVSSIIEELNHKYKINDDDINIIAVGEIIRKEIKEKTKLGKRLIEIINQGKLVDDVIINEIMQQQLIKVNGKIIFFDGFPRTIAQADEFLELMKNYNYGIVFRDTSVELILSRVKNRRICTVCGTSHDVGEGACDKCGGKLVKRSDDEALPNRLQTFEETTRPAIDKLCQEKANLFYFDGDMDGKDVAVEFLEKNQEFLK